jgi:hypothetical protein
VVDPPVLAADELDDRVGLVGNGRRQHDPDAERLEALGEPGRVRVLHVAGDDLVADRQDRAEHGPEYDPRAPPNGVRPSNKTVTEACRNCHRERRRPALRLDPSSAGRRRRGQTP